MHPTCYELIITVEESKKEFLSEILYSLDENNFVEGAVDCDIEFDYTNMQTTTYYDKYAAGTPLIIYSEDKAHLEWLESEIKKVFSQHEDNANSEIKCLIKAIDDQNWRESWKESFKPVDIDGVFCILPPWENTADFPQRYKIIIDPGMAFGTGQHETTKLCLKYLISENTYERVLDVGTGSGILAIAAALKRDCHILGCDIETESIDIAKENATKNGTPNIVFVSTLLDKIEEDNFDLVFANIQNKPLRMLMKDIKKRMSAKGRLIISGILVSECDDFKDFLTTLGLEVKHTEHLGAWAGLLCTKA